MEILHYKRSMYGFCFMFGIKSLFVMNNFCFHSASQDKNFCLQEQEFVVGSARLKKTFESIESNRWPNSSRPTKPRATSSLSWITSRDGDCTASLHNPCRCPDLKELPTELRTGEAQEGKDVGRFGRSFFSLWFRESKSGSLASTYQKLGN